MVRHSKHHHIDSFILFSFAVISILAVSNGARLLLKLHTIMPPLIIIKKEKKEIFNQAAFSNIHIKAHAYVVYDIVDSKIIASKNATSTMPLASLTKVMMAYTAYNHLDRNNRIIISQRSIEDGYDLGLRNGQSWALEELLKYTLVFSSNDGAQAIADSKGRSQFVAQMNADAESLGLGLKFTHPAGVDNDDMLGGSGSALDVAKLFTLARRQFPQILDATTKKRVNVTSSVGRVTGIPNTNQYIDNIEGAEASKTGYTDLAGGNLAIVTDMVLGHPVVIVVLGSTREERFSDIQILYKALQNSIVR